MVKRCHLVVMFHPLPIFPVFIYAHRSPASSRDNRPPTNRGAHFPRQWWIGKIGSASTTFGWFVLVFPFHFFLSSYLPMPFVVLKLKYNVPSLAMFFCQWWIAILVGPAFTSLLFHCFPVFFFLLIVDAGYGEDLKSWSCPCVVPYVCPFRLAWSRMTLVNAWRWNLLPCGLDLPLCLLLLKLTNVDSPLFLGMYVAYFADHRRDEIDNLVRTIVTWG